MNQEILDHSLPEVNTETPDYIGDPVHLLNDRSIYFKGFFGMMFCIIPAGIIGLILVKISLDQAKEATDEYQRSPGKYKQVSMETVRQGRTMARVGLAAFIVEILAFVIYTSA